MKKPLNSSSSQSSKTPIENVNFNQTVKTEQKQDQKQKQKQKVHIHVELQHTVLPLFTEIFTAIATILERVVLRFQHDAIIIRQLDADYQALVDVIFKNSLFKAYMVNQEIDICIKVRELKKILQFLASKVKQNENSFDTVHLIVRPSAESDYDFWIVTADTNTDTTDSFSFIPFHADMPEENASTTTSTYVLFYQVPSIHDFDADQEKVIPNVPNFPVDARITLPPRKFKESIDALMVLNNNPISDVIQIKYLGAEPPTIEMRYEKGFSTAVVRLSDARTLKKDTVEVPKGDILSFYSDYKCLYLRKFAHLDSYGFFEGVTLEFGQVKPLIVSYRYKNNDIHLRFITAPENP